eukprot:1240018-Rhodomonas_salina.1
MMWIGVSCQCSRSIRKVNCSTCRVVAADAPGSSACCIVLQGSRGVVTALRWQGATGTCVREDQGAGVTVTVSVWDGRRGKDATAFFFPGYPLNCRFEANES